MNRALPLFLGVFLTFLSAWLGLVLAPTLQLNALQPQVVAGVTQPRPYTDQELAGRRVYIREGCVYCHSQQIRGGRYQNDDYRGWGPRRTVPRDYVHDRPVLLGTMRTGPDLVNIGRRQPDATWHHQHLYDPQLLVPGSIMAPYPFLYEKRRLAGPAPSGRAVPFDFVRVTLDSPAALDALQAAGFQPATQRDGEYLGRFDPARLDALRKIPGVKAVRPYVEDGFEIVPTADADALVAYLKSLDRSYPLENAPAPR